MTSIDAVDIVYSRIKGSDLDVETSGVVHKGQRPLNNNLEDIVINNLGMDNQDLQRSIVNVNIYVPNKPISINGVEDTTQPNHARFKTLATKAWAVLRDSWALDYNFDIQNEVLIRDEENLQWYLNIRLDFRNINS